MAAVQINGVARTRDAPDDMPLLWVLRDLPGLSGIKFGCGVTQCAACTVHLAGRPVRSCLCRSDRSAVVPSRRLRRSVRRRPAAKFSKPGSILEVVQCGYCQSGQTMSAAGLLVANPNPEDADIDAAQARLRHACRPCGP